MNFYLNPPGPALLHITIDKDVCPRNNHTYNESGWQNRVKSVLDSTEPALSLSSSVIFDFFHLDKEQFQNHFGTFLTLRRMGSLQQYSKIEEN